MLIIRAYTFYSGLVHSVTKIKNNKFTGLNKSDTLEDIENNIYFTTISALSKGIKKDVGVQLTHHSLSEPYYKCDVLLTFGINKKSQFRGRCIQKLWKQHKRHKLIIEKGYIHRDKYYMVGWNGLNGYANFCNNNSPSDRWSRLNVSLQPWRIKQTNKTPGNYILLCGQAPLDASVQHMMKSTTKKSKLWLQWCQQIIKEIKYHTNKRICYRPHPHSFYAVNIKKLTRKYKIQTSCQNTNLLKDLTNCWCVVTFNSNVGVDAIIQGIPVISLDKGSMVYDITSHDLKDVVNPPMKTRTQWANDIAYTQWTIEEMEQGLPWQHLKKIYD